MRVVLAALALPVLVQLVLAQHRQVQPAPARLLLAPQRLVQLLRVLQQLQLLVQRPLALPQPQLLQLQLLQLQLLQLQVRLLPSARQLPRWAQLVWSLALLWLPL